MLKPVTHAKLSDQVFVQLRDEILTGRYHPNDRLPSERILCEKLEVNRSSVREALKRLEHARLIDTRQGGGSTVLDFRSHAGLDLLRDLVAPAGHLDPLVARSVFEFARATWPEMTRLAALRASDRDLAELRRIVGEIDAALEDTARLQDLDLEFFARLARASENLAFQLVMNTVSSVYDDYRELFTLLYARRADEAGPRYRGILGAVVAGDGRGAAELSRELLEGLADAFHESYPTAWPTERRSSPGDDG